MKTETVAVKILKQANGSKKYLIVLNIFFHIFITFVEMDQK